MRPAIVSSSVAILLALTGSSGSTNLEEVIAWNFLQDLMHADRPSSIRNNPWCPPTSAILDHKLTESRRSSGEPTSRALPAARHSSFSRAPTLSFLSCSFFSLLLAVSHSRTLPVDLLGAGSDRCSRQVFGQSAPRRTLI